MNLGEDDLEWTTPSGKEVRWMNKNDMKQVGITSGVKKVLQAVEKSSSLKLDNSSSIHASKSKTKKRKK